MNVKTFWQEIKKSLLPACLIGISLIAHMEEYGFQERLLIPGNFVWWNHWVVWFDELRDTEPVMLITFYQWEPFREVLRTQQVIKNNYL